PLQLIFETNLLVGNRPVAQCTERQPQRTWRQRSEIACNPVGPVSEVSPEEFVRALAAEGNCCPDFAKLGEKPNRQRSGICTRLVRVVGKFLDCALQVLLRIQVQLLVLGSILLCCLLYVLGFVEAAPPEGDRKCLQPGT